MSYRLGYRFQQPEGSFFLKVAYTPYTRLTTNNPHITPEGRGYNGFFHWFGIGIGRTF